LAFCRTLILNIWLNAALITILIILCDKSIRLVVKRLSCELVTHNTNGGLNDGNDAIGVPNYQVVLGGEWDVPRVQNVTLTGKVIRTGSQYLNEANTQKLDAWTRLDLGVRYAMPMQEHTLTWRANLENVTNENYWASATGGYLTQGTPRQFKLSATYDF